MIRPLLLLLASAALAGGPDPLSDVEVPLPDNLDDFVVDADAAIRLGKALFWDVQVGSDGQVACATCHFQAGADVRTVNTIHPGANGVVDVVLPLDAADFPFQHDDIVGSQGVAPAAFDGQGAGGHPADACTPTGPAVRGVTGRNAPPAVSAAFHELQFWDGRAVEAWDGATVGGGAGAVIWADDGAGPQPIAVAIAPASLASQASGPPLDGTEMSCAGRTFADIGQKLINNGLVPLGQQEVHPADSVLGALSLSPAGGLDATYADLIADAFDPRFVGDDLVGSGAYTQSEANFSLFFGLSVLMYEATLIPDQTPYDLDQLTPLEERGLEVFEGTGGAIRATAIPSSRTPRRRTAATATPSPTPRCAPRPRTRARGTARSSRAICATWS